MSLTEILTAPGSRLRAFFQKRLPASRQFVTSRNRQVRARPVRGGEPDDPRLAGTAIDFRFRLHFPPPPGKPREPEEIAERLSVRVAWGGRSTAG